ncbi:phage/plasmid primase, P4 family [Phocaeicola sp.]|uniref:DNA primase family protein n=1 Tax=Phocaeicola sp. TaxID=2773926 RepID=UPI0023D219E4|nr:phage/plasmid primase, P4 family [Phocaeicola sp.]MDE5677838.1 DNA primase [Phocaeicola sp.]
MEKSKSLIRIFPEQQAVSQNVIMERVIENTSFVDYDRKTNEAVYKKADKEEDIEIKNLILGRALKPDIEDKAIIASENLARIFDNLGYGIQSDGVNIYIYNTCCWTIIDNRPMKHFLTKFLIKTGIRKTEAENVNHIEKYFRQIVYSLYVEPKQQNPNEALVNANNCTIVIDLKGNVSCRSHNKNDGFFYVLPFKYDVNADAPRFRLFLDEVIPGDIQLPLQEFFGCCLLPSLKIEKVLCCVGSGLNGKSVLFETMTYVLGKENVTTFNINNLCESQSNTRYMLQNKLLNYSSDFSGQIWNNGFFKQLASGEPVEVKKLYQDPIIIENYARLAYNSNQMPNSSDTSAGFRRRLLLVEFTKKVANPDPFLVEKLKKEASGILNWMIEGLVRYIKNGNKFSQSTVLNQSLSSFESATDNVKMFLEDSNSQPGTDSISLKDFYSWYKAYCDSNKIKPLQQQDFKVKLGDYDFKIEGGGKSKKAYSVLIDKTALKLPSVNPFDTNITSSTSPFPKREERRK